MGCYSSNFRTRISNAISPIYVIMFVTYSLCEHQLHSNHPSNNNVTNKQSQNGEFFLLKNKIIKYFSLFLFQLFNHTKVLTNLKIVKKGILTGIGLGSNETTTPAISVILCNNSIIYKNFIRYNIFIDILGYIALQNKKIRK